MRFLITILFFAGTSAIALDSQSYGIAFVADETTNVGQNDQVKRFMIRGFYYDFCEVMEEDVELKRLSSLVPVEVVISDTDRGYLVVCGIYDQHGEFSEADWDFSDYESTSLFFDWNPEERVPTIAKCYRTEGLSISPNQ